MRVAPIRCLWLGHRAFEKGDMHHGIAGLLDLWLHPPKRRTHPCRVHFHKRSPFLSSIRLKHHSLEKIISPLCYIDELDGV